MFNLEETKRICEQATPGPWNHSGPDSIGEWCVYDGKWMVLEASCHDGISAEQANANADFAVHARTALPLAVAEIERLEKENAELKLKMSKWTYEH